MSYLYIQAVIGFAVAAEFEVEATVYGMSLLSTDAD